jgi:predicted lipoprotein
LSLLALQDLASRLADGNDGLSDTLDASFDRALSQLTELDDPTFSSVADPFTRIKVEIVQTSVELIRAQVRDELGPSLGVAAGFNALDGD